jgi:hypothetical protein
VAEQQVLLVPSTRAAVSLSLLKTCFRTVEACRIMGQRVRRWGRQNNPRCVVYLCRSDPVDRMISHFTATFRPDSYEEGCSLAITGGRGGARLTHSHER